MGIAAFVLAHWGLLYLPFSAAIPPLFGKLQMNYFLPIHYHQIWGGHRAKCGRELGSYGDAEQKDIDLESQCDCTLYFIALLRGWFYVFWSISATWGYISSLYLRSGSVNCFVSCVWIQTNKSFELITTTFRIGLHDIRKTGDMWQCFQVLQWRYDLR